MTVLAFTGQRSTGAGEILLDDVSVTPTPPVTYSYTGSSFSECNGVTGPANGNCPANYTSDYILASFGFSAPLDANLSSVDESSSPNLAAWTIRDALGYSFFSSEDPNAAAELVALTLSTNSAGKIVAWNIQISDFTHGESGGTGFFMTSPTFICGGTGLPCADNIVSINGSSSNLGNATPGQWTETLNAFQGGTAAAPVFVLSGSPVAGVNGTISGSGAEEYYEFYWAGGE